MSGTEPLPQSSLPFPGAQSSIRPQPRPLSSLISHYRELFSQGAKRRKTSGSLFSQTLARVHAVEPEPARDKPPETCPVKSERHPAHHVDVAEYTYNFAQDFADSDDMIESDATEDCSDFEPPELGGDADPVPSPRRQAQYMPKREPGDYTVAGLPQEETTNLVVNLAKYGETRGELDKIYESPLLSLDGRTSDILSTGDDWDTDVTVCTSPPPEKFEDEDIVADSREEDQSMGRQPSLQLGTTPTSVRYIDHMGSRTVSEGSELLEPENEEQPRTKPNTRPKCKNQRTGAAPAEIEETVVESRQSEAVPESPAAAPLEQSLDVIDCDSWPISSEEQDTSPQYTVSDAIMDMHQLMSKPFWADDENWLAAVAHPVQSSQPFTPFSDDIIKKTTNLIEMIEWIKAKKGNSAQARFASAMKRRIATVIAKIQDACAAIYRYLFGDQQQPPRRNVCIHEETVLRMRKYAIPRLVVVLSKTFTLLCNQLPEVRSLVIFVMEHIGLETERIAKIVEFGTKKGVGGSDHVDEVEEFIHSLAVVREWAKTEANVKHGGKAARSTAL